ncbi:MAG: plasmid maintenance system antidote protein [Bacteroidetes bacterium]|nr:plasmid maintenance system antidote protein [Bacteroidota bacterium]
MDIEFEKYKGIHPGIVLDRLLRKEAISKRHFAISIGEYPQTLNAITKGKRRMNIPFSLKAENKLGLPEGTLSLLQTYFEIEQEKKSQIKITPDFNIIRKTIFWDTDIEKIDWLSYQKSVIQRVMEMGNEAEKQEIIRFYNLNILKLN